MLPVAKIPPEFLDGIGIHRDLIQRYRCRFTWPRLAPFSAMQYFHFPESGKLLATKYTAFLDRGDRDYHGSHDLEDFVTVVDGSAEIVAEVDRAPLGLRRFAITSIRQLGSDPKFHDALPGSLPPEEEDRIGRLRGKLEGIASLALPDN
jgi:hypothetical protein